MAELVPLYIRSTAPGMVWRIGSYKAPGRPARVTASEGSDPAGDGCWSCDLLNCRTFKQEVAGRATKAALRDAVLLLLVQMRQSGAIAKEDANRISGDGSTTSAA
jgi:hypothetical protein